ncbi:SMP-30/gluconolactonase/LRE family protein [Ktedonosporobacter rubrisoli]|uniref:SMP-30/gluconolactonase/LRE family protein n=1 Tax=Ktedonosporobacter rubrisoli TaxID=2509675 RepID=A0A4P6JXQ2_KTERU|nr:SMP-30/gluconolactonase/LRE family protein [Ktedonosporobacter rubrisoli]QBD80160.1 SMP-30/gluconolactonase/LRE family protein [Ktedonosporobacter rubrisoli]
MSSLEHILASQNRLGEGALWSVDEQVLYWVDIENRCYCRLNPASGAHETISVGVMIGVLAQRSSGGLIMATEKGIALWDPQGQNLRYIAHPAGIEKPYMRFNDGAVDCAGRFWAGTMHMDESLGIRDGVLYRLDPDGSVHTMETGLGTPNGIGWSPDNATMYFTDSDMAVRSVYAYDFDPTTGNISQRRVLAQFPPEMGTPDGLTVDSEGYIWSAFWDGARIVRYDPSGKIEREIDIPALRPTSCVFGGANLNELYITSASTGLSAEQKARYPFSGDLFRLSTNFRGLTKHKFAG